MTKDRTFEDAVQRIDCIVEQMEKEDVPLETSLNLYDEAIKLINECVLELNQAQKFVYQLDNDLNLKIFDDNGD